MRGFQNCIRMECRTIMIRKWTCCIAQKGMEIASSFHRNDWTIIRDREATKSEADRISSSMVTFLPDIMVSLKSIYVTAYSSGSLIFEILYNKDHQTCWNYYNGFVIDSKQIEGCIIFEYFSSFLCI